jgi:hypothetical protein
MQSLNSKKIINQKGIVLLEFAGYAFILAIITAAMFSLGTALVTRYCIDQTLEDSLSRTSVFQQPSRIAKQVVTGSGDVDFVYQDVIAQTVSTTVAQISKTIKESKSFIKELPFRIESTVYKLDIDPKTGKPLGFSGFEAKQTEGNLSVPSSVLSVHSINEMYNQVTNEKIDNLLSPYAEPIGMVVYNDSENKYMPFVPIATVCIYLKDNAVIVSDILETVFEDGIIASCRSAKIRDFI